MIESRVIKIDYLGPHRISITGGTGTSYSLTNIDFMRIYSDTHQNKKGRKTWQEKIYNEDEKK